MDGAVGAGPHGPPPGTTYVGGPPTLNTATFGLLSAVSGA